MDRHLFWAAAAWLVFAAAPGEAAAQPQRGPLSDAQDILKNAGAPSADGLAVGYLQEQIVDLVGKKATGKLGKIAQGDYTKFFAQFQAGGVVLMSTTEEGNTFKGTWSQSGNTITMKAGASTFSGTLEGNRLSGTRSRQNAKGLKDTVDMWELTIE
jgi:hypothetical protein